MNYSSVDYHNKSNLGLGVFLEITMAQEKRDSVPKNSSSSQSSQTHQDPTPPSHAEAQQKLSLKTTGRRQKKQRSKQRKMKLFETSHQPIAQTPQTDKLT
jgi:hypothetical protein